MTAQLDREGIFKARPVSWRVKQFDGKQSVAINIEFAIVAQLDGSEWISWEGAEEHRVYGDFWVVKKDGTPNVEKIQQLAAAIGWGGSLKQVVIERPPECVAQITVKPEEYKGKTSYRADWIEPEDFKPGGGGATTAEVDQLEARFGSLLRAAAGSKVKTTKPAQKAAAPVAPPADPAEPINADTSPF